MILFDGRIHRKAIVGCALVAACGRTSPPPEQQDSSGDKTVDSTITGSQTPRPDSLARHRQLAPLADSISQRLVFVPTTQTWFLAAARAKRLLVDIGRIDDNVTKPATRLAAYKQAVVARSPLPVGSRLRLRGAWGADDVVVDGFDVWNGRIVATIKGTQRVDSLARRVDPLVAVAQRIDSAAPSVEHSCVRDSADAALRRRLDALRDSVLEVLRQGDQPGLPRLLSTLKERSSRTFGCFPLAKVVLVTSLVAGDYEWVRQRTLLVAADGKATPITIRDFRFRTHDLLGALDADEDGMDDVAARAYTERAGGTVVLRMIEGKRLERLAAGFAWER